MQEEEPTKPKHVFVKSVVCGGLAGCVAKTVVAPLERLRILRQVEERGTFASAASRVWRQEGFVGFWTGNSANLARIAPARGLAFATNDLLKRRFCDNSFLTGGLAGLLSTAATYPLDLVRGRQAGHVGATSKNFAAALFHFARTDGLRSLYGGAAPTLLGAIPFEGVKFGVFDFCQKKRHTKTPASKATDGAVAGLVAGLTTFPNDTIRRLLQQRHAPYEGYLDCASKLLHAHGPARLYAGLTPNLLKAVPSAGLQFFTFEFLKDRLL